MSLNSPGGSTLQWDVWQDLMCLVPVAVWIIVFSVGPVLVYRPYTLFFFCRSALACMLYRHGGIFYACIYKGVRALGYVRSGCTLLFDQRLFPVDG